ncbi:MAG: beta-phosphoglucomutase [Enterococcaceae bacterium]|jgi:beta-phosphoglucomutase|nr:beta-phosphoglucomutase [Enterococcaceae bacterium]MCI1918576.1 beta-phosphoglucomutase [Enterococcaceae bacterium]
MFKGVLFDLDGVITDTAAFHFKAWKRLADQLGIPLDPAFNEKLKGLSREDSLRLILEKGGLDKKISAAEFQRLAHEKNEYYLKLIAEMTPQDVFPGILPLLKALKMQKIKCALASASKNAPLLLDKLQLTSYFAAIADPQKVERGKPAPDLFIAAARGISLAPDECIGIEDATAGIQALLASGALPVAVGDPANFPAGITCVSSTKELTTTCLTEAWKKAGRK